MAYKEDKYWRHTRARSNILRVCLEEKSNLYSTTFDSVNILVLIKAVSETVSDMITTYHDNSLISGRATFQKRSVSHRQETRNVVSFLFIAKVGFDSVF